MPPPPPTPAENFAALLTGLTRAVPAMSGGDRLSYFLIGLIVTRIRVITQGFARLVAGLAAGTFLSRRYAPRRPPAQRRPRRQNPLGLKFGWLKPLVPDINGFRAQLENLLRDPEMAALIATAPASLARPLRSACWMLGLRPPPLLKPPPRAKPPKPPKPPPTPKPPPPPPLPAWLQDRRKPWSLARIRGSPRPA